jgi:hypothetical protein
MPLTRKPSAERASLGSPTSDPGTDLPHLTSRRPSAAVRVNKCSLLPVATTPPSVVPSTLGCASTEFGIRTDPRFPNVSSRLPGVHALTINTVASAASNRSWMRKLVIASLQIAHSTRRMGLERDALAADRIPQSASQPYQSRMFTRGFVGRCGMRSFITCTSPHHGA